MSIVGTRPPLISETNLYEPHHKVRLAIKPGITGMWQVSGRSDITDFEKVVRLDKEYIENWNIGLDIKILFKLFNKHGISYVCVAPFLLHGKKYVKFQDYWSLIIDGNYIGVLSTLFCIHHKSFKST